MSDTPPKMQAWVQADRLAALGQLTAGIAHELNNPVGYLLSNLRSFEIYLPVFIEYFTIYQALSATNDATSRQQLQQQLLQLQQREDLAFLLNDTQQLLQDSMAGLLKIKDLVLDLRRFSHPDLAEPQLIELTALVQDSLRLVRHQLKNNIVLNLSLAETPLWIRGRPAALSQVLVNILLNACQAIGPQRGTIWLTCRVNDDGEAELCVTDSGAGISPLAMPHLFEPFFTTKAVGQGTGLGLAICHSIIHQHHGQLDAYNSADAGACFRIRLPLQAAPVD